MSPEKLPRQDMPEQPPADRAANFEEVPYGYTDELAQAEASRCLQCKNPKCVGGCPVSVDIPGFVSLIAEGKFQEAAVSLKKQNVLPAVCGRVCPQETQCEGVCILGKKGDSVAVGNLERFAADYVRDSGVEDDCSVAPPNGRKIAIVGSGPAGLTAAGELARAGCEVTIFEALHEPGGVLVYGIPEFRLPKVIVAAEVDFLRKLGVKIVTDFVVGRTRTIDGLLNEDGFDAVFVGSGAGLPIFLGIEGEDLNCVYSANEYLLRSNLMKAYDPEKGATPLMRGEHVAVVGGGNVAMDAARTALRLGADKVTLVYRRSREEMPARDAEIHHAGEEGIEFKLLTNPVRLIGDDNGRVKEMECLRMELGEPDESGRRRPVAIEGSEFTIPADVVIIAIGNRPNPLIPQTTSKLGIGKWGNIDADTDTGKTSMARVYAGGDVVTGAATVIEAMGAGKRAAEAILDDLGIAGAPK